MSQVTNVKIDTDAYDTAMDYLDDAETNAHAAHKQVVEMVEELRSVQGRLESLLATVTGAVDEVVADLEGLASLMDQASDEASDAAINLSDARAHLDEDQPAEAAPSVVQATGTAVLHAVG